MKKYFLLTLITLSFSHLASAQFGKEWLTCKTDDDCIKINGICERKDSINKKYSKEFDEFVQKMRAVSNCMTLSEKEKNYNETSVAKCIARQCKLEDQTTKK